jgi:hypothetical protein
MTNRILTFIYGALSHALFFATFLYAIGLAGNFAVDKPLDSISGNVLVAGLSWRTVSLRAFAVTVGTDSGGLFRP